MKIRHLLFGTLAFSALLFSCGSGQEAATDTAPESAAATTVTEENQEVQVITLNQIPGKFTNGDLSLDAGTYKFEVSNSGVDHEVGLVLAPKKDEITEADHIQNAYVTETVKNGDTKSCKGEVVLEKGEYVYFCPLNPTGHYNITVN